MEVLAETVMTRNETEHRNGFLSWPFGYFPNPLKLWFIFVSGSEFLGKVGSECLLNSSPNGIVEETGMCCLEDPFFNQIISGLITLNSTTGKEPLKYNLFAVTGKPMEKIVTVIDS
ncbi:hypothetical protein TNCV_4260941 [Trichonephila clavipes]|nr:hypothetical protein TNCV_4260941 [Trichonephila clavipes]